MKTLKQIWNKFFGKKEEPSILEFMSKVAELAKELNEPYYNVKISLRSEGCSDKGYLFESYINGMGHIYGREMNECIDKIKEEIRNK